MSGNSIVTWIEIDSLSDERLAPYRDIRNRNWTERSGWFIAEGPPLVEQLLASSYTCQSVLVDRKYQSHFDGKLDRSIDVLVVDHPMVEELVGFNFHRGIMACGVRKPQRTIVSLPSLEPSETLVGLVGVQDPENLGGIMRTCAALGVHRILIGPGCCDPLSRRSLRVSMGNALKLDIFHSRDAVGDSICVRDRFGVESYAASPAEDRPGLPNRSLSLTEVRRPQPALVWFGNERHGLPDDILRAADYRVRIDMRPGVDSLNVSVAAGIVLHYFCKMATGPDRPQ